MPLACGLCNAQGRLCTEDCWCWEAPRPSGYQYRAAWGASPDDVWFAAPSALVRRTDAGWALHRAPWREAPQAIWGSAPNDVWVVGGDGLSGTGRIAHWNGAEWQAVATDAGALYGVHGFSATDVWAVGDGTLLHWNGTSWQSTPVGLALRDVWGANPNDVWAAGGGVLLRWNGGSWQTVGIGGATLQDLDGTSATDVWGVGSGGLWHFDGAQWARVDAGLRGELQRVEAISRTEVWLGGSTFAGSPALAVLDGGGWERVALGDQPSTDLLFSTGGELWVGSRGTLIRREASGAWAFETHFGGLNIQSIVEVSPTEQWAVGRSGTILRGDGQRWQRLVTGEPEDLHAVGAAGGVIWAGGVGGTILRSTGGPFVRVRAGSNPTVTGIFALSANEVWAVSGDTVLVWNGSTFVPMGAQPPYSALTSVWASAPDDIWVGSNNGVHRFNGSTWSAAGSTSAILAVWGSGTEVFAARGTLVPPAGSIGQALRWNGTGWTDLGATTGLSYTGVSGRSATEVYFVGDGVVLEWNGSTARVLTNPVANWLKTVGGTWAVDRHGQLFHWTSGGVVRVTTVDGSSFDDSLYGLFGFGQANVWAVGEKGTPRRYDGTRWISYDAPNQFSSASNLYGVWGIAPNDVWAVGWGGRMLRFNGQRWRDANSPIGISLGQLRDVWGAAANDVWAVGTGVLAHWNGTQWTTAVSGPSFSRLWGTGPADVWATGDTAMHFDGGGWTRVDAGAGVRLGSIWGAAPNDYWAVGGGDVFRYDGAAWRKVAVPSGQAVGVWGRAAADVYVFTSGGGVLYWDGGSFSPAAWTGSTEGVFRAWGDDGGVWAIGDLARGIFRH